MTAQDTLKEETASTGGSCCAPSCCGGAEEAAVVSPQPSTVPAKPPAQVTPPGAERVVEQVRERYGRIAAVGSHGCGCSESASTGLGYSQAELETLPEGADLGLGCGAPVERLALRPGETVLDLGSGAGIDAFLAAARVGPEGRVIGVDMTPEMLERARANAARRGVANVEFREGRLEALPVADASVDAVTSNCVINLVPDKAAVFREVARVLRPGGRLVVSDIVLDGALPEALEQSLLAWVGCVAGAMQRERYFGLLRESGLGDLEVLSDEPFLKKLGGELPDDMREVVDAAGVKAEEVAPRVRSVTYRAVKRGVSARSA